MRVISLRLRNYRKFRDAAVEFGDGIIAITGLNGAGKSTIVEAMAWALYGNYRRIIRKGDSKKGIKSVSASPSDTTGVYLEFEIDGNNYYLAREMRGSSGTMVVELKENGAVQASGNAAVSKFVEKKIGLDAEGFLTSVFARQKELSALSDPEPEKRRKKIEKMLGLDAIDSAREMIRADRRDKQTTLEVLREGVFDDSGSPIADSIKSEIKEMEGKIADMKNELTEINKKHENLKKELGGLEKEVNELREREREHSSLNAEIRGINGEIVAKKSETERLKKELEDIERLKERAVELEKSEERYIERMRELDEMRNERERYLDKRRKEEKKREYLGRIEKAGSNIKRIENDIEGIERHDLKELNASINRLKKRNRELENAQGELKGRIGVLKREFKKLKHDREIIKEEGAESKCPTCHRKLGEDFEHILEEIGQEMEEREKGLMEAKEEIKKIEKEISDVVVKIDKAEKERRAAEREEERRRLREEEKKRYEDEMSSLEKELKVIDSELSEIGEVNFDKESFSELKRDVEELEKTHREYLQIKAKIEREKQVEERISSLKMELETMESRLISLKRKLKELNFSEEMMKKTEKELVETREKERALANSILSLEKDIRNAEGRVTSKREKLAELEKKMDKIEGYEEEIRYLGEVEALLKDFRSGAILKIRPALQEIASELFSSMTDGRYPGIEIDDDYNIRIIDVGGSYPIGRFSGGEEDLANLCLRLAISEVVVKVRGASGVNFLVLDEIFGSQDQIRRENILRALQSLSNRFHQIFLISHIDVMGESRNMVLNVKENENGESQIIVD